MLLELLLLLVLLCLLDYIWKYRDNSKLRKLPGPLNFPIIGCVWLFLRVQPDDLIDLSRQIIARYGRITKFWILNIPSIYVSDVQYIQALLSHPTEIKKNSMYSLLIDWLADGLLVSYGPKWLNRRRVITPTFHFSILEDFVKIYDQQAQILVQKLAKNADNGQAVDVHDAVALATLDVICETAMGVRINAQTDPDCEYVRLLHDMTALILQRYVNIAYRSKKLFELLAPKLAKKHKTVVSALHEFTERIIMERRQSMLEQQTSIADMNQSNDLGIKRRLALLDVLLSSTIDGSPLTNNDIREEVDTFMFEGHDTTKSGIGFTLYCISRATEVQQKLYEEIVEVLGTDAQQEFTYRQLMELKYTEKVIKEALRMYPPVPFIGREITQDAHINGICFPKGTNVLLGLIAMQNDAEYFPQPERFLPERDNNENVFAFVPFSAGPRNCIGQRFAMLEMKAFICRIVQQYELLPLGRPVEPTLSVVLTSKTGWQMGFRKRQTTTK